MEKEGLSILNSESFSFHIRNTGASVAVFRIRVYIDGGEPPYIKQGVNHKRLAFDNCMFAQNPIPSPFPGGGPYPKRTKIYRNDSNNFSNNFWWVNRAAKEKGEEKKYRIMRLPHSEGEHKIRFGVEQTGENYVFKYRAKNNGIKPHSEELVTKYGGRTVTGIFRALIQRPRYEDIGRFEMIKDWFLNK